MNGFSTGEEDSRGPPDQECSLVDDGERCRRPAGNASYSKRIQKTVTQRRLKLHLDNLFTPYTLVILVTNVDAPIWFQARHIYICDYHKGVIQSARTKRRRKDSEDDSNETDTDVPEVDLFQLHLNTLRRYNRFYKVTQRPLTTKNKAPLADVRPPRPTGVSPSSPRGYLPDLPLEGTSSAEPFPSESNVGSSSSSSVLNMLPRKEKQSETWSSGTETVVHPPGLGILRQQSLDLLDHLCGSVTRSDGAVHHSLKRRQCTSP
uniref:Histone deacetylase complex subunit SAP30 zinc-finger domain-containing protein n=1 Tax=Timema cristinae TaxID=61476 RepID=A0A7R9CL26_TIMCR|nr:unnamed protein product [Timema cristinae]